MLPASPAVAPLAKLMTWKIYRHPKTILGWNRVAYVQKTFMCTYIYIIYILYVYILYDMYIYIYIYITRNFSENCSTGTRTWKFWWPFTNSLPLWSRNMCWEKMNPIFTVKPSLWGRYPFFVLFSKFDSPSRQVVLGYWYRNYVWRNSTIMSSWLCMYVY